MNRKPELIQSISAVTLATVDMPRAIAFYNSLGLQRHRGGPGADFTTFSVGTQHVNLRKVQVGTDREDAVLVIFAVSSVDDACSKLIESGATPEFLPRNAEWGQRYFHVRDPDGHLPSFTEQLLSAPDNGCSADAAKLTN